MITQNEISSLNLSPTKKDFVQIWNELIEVASKITERWDPTSTNESDPGIVLLKVLAGIADKLNYNIDKNILEAYMPTAAQMESMRKLCELVGYDIKYYQSAETRVRISYTGNTNDEEEKLPATGLALPKFTTITNADKDITFVTTNAIPVLITNDTPWVEVPCIEGQISQCESSNENNLITLAQLDDENRYYLPEVQIAENGIFVYNAITAKDKNNAPIITDGTSWERVSNLNTQPVDTRVFKFGYDSFEGRPYLAFPADIGSLIGDGLFIYFVRTSGLSGNISPRTLEVLELPAGDGWGDYSTEKFEVVNVDATTNGANIENISTAYNNFKKTVGTFDTLVTCRDYMNKIYSLMDANNTPYVSNILVTDIRNDINNAFTLCSCNEFGILYKDTPVTKSVRVKSTHRTVDQLDGSNTWQLVLTGDPDDVIEEPLIDHFDLILYPFKTFTQVSSGTKDKNLAEEYNKSFTYSEQRTAEINSFISDLKTCAHNLTVPAVGEIVSINNYLRLDALIATSTKVSEAEAESILKNVKVALINEFNLRNLDFGEEIPFDNILSVIENADSRIKVVSLQEPTVLTTYSIKEDSSSGAKSTEYGIASVDKDGNEITINGVNYTGNTAKDIYNKLMIRNILAGRASLFDYDETFISNNSEKPYTVTSKLDFSEVTGNLKTTLENELGELLEASTNLDIGETVLDASGPHGGVLTLHVFEKQQGIDADGKPIIVKEKEISETYEPYEHGIINNIKRVEAVCEIHNTENTFRNITLDKNEVIKFRAPNLITTNTFPAYVYYRFERGASNEGAGANAAGSYAECKSLNSFINEFGVHEFFTKLWELAGDNLRTFTAQSYDARPTINTPGEPASTFNTSIAIKTTTKLNPNNTASTYTSEDGTVYIYVDEGSLQRDIEAYFADEANKDSIVTFSSYPLNNGTMAVWSECIKSFKSDLPGDTVLWRLSNTSGHPKGKLVTESGQRLYAQSGEYLTNSRVGDSTYICTDLGQNPAYYLMSENSDIELGPNDKLYIHYTPSSTNEDGESEEAEPISIVYEGGTIIRPSGFTLIPSEDVHRQGTSWKKTDVDFNGVKKDLLALAPNEQIELRSISKVILNSNARFYKNFDNDDLEHGNINAEINYELKDGEYIFYTDQNTQEAAYYGSGSVITLEGGAFIPKAEDHIEIAQILERGLHEVPWSEYVKLSSDKKITITEYQYVTLVAGDTLDTLTVNQGVEATSDSTEVSTSSSTSTNGGYTLNNKKWLKCESSEDNPIIYTPAGSKTSVTLPIISLRSGLSTSWEVCSFLELSTSPGSSQQLRMASKSSTTVSTTPAITDATGATNTDTSTHTDVITITNKLNLYSDIDPDSEPTATIAPVTESDPVSFKLSTIAQTASGNFAKTDSDLEDDIDDSIMQVKIFKEDAPKLIELDNNDEVITPISDKSYSLVEPFSVSLNNYWTRLEIDTALHRANPDWSNTAAEDISKTLPLALNLNFIVPENSDVFGIFSIYLDMPEDKLNTASKYNIPKADARVFIDIPKEFGPFPVAQNTTNQGTANPIISIFNCKTHGIQENGGRADCLWWPDGINVGTPNRLYLRAGLNCIRVNRSCNLLIKAEKNAVGSILYDNMRLVKGINTYGINLKLLDPNATYNTLPATDKTSKAATLAKDILDKLADFDKKQEFYYNVPVENSLAIEFDKNISSFSDPHTLYDINNVNNDFVISKLDIKYLKDGLKIAKSSKY